MGSKLVSTALFTDHLDAARRFYEQALGQVAQLDSPQHVSFEGGMALWSRPLANQVLFGEAAPTKPQGTVFELCFESDDLETCLQACLDAGGKLHQEIKVQIWQQRVFRVFDPDGHLIEAGEPLSQTAWRLLDEGLLAEQAAAKMHTSLAEFNALLA